MVECCKNCIHRSKAVPTVGIKIPCTFHHNLVQPMMRCEAWDSEENKLKDFQKIENLLKKFNEKYGENYFIGS